MLGSLGVGTTKDRILRSLADIIRFCKERIFLFLSALGGTLRSGDSAARSRRTSAKTIACFENLHSSIRMNPSDRDEVKYGRRVHPLWAFEFFLIIIAKLQEKVGDKSRPLPTQVGIAHHLPTIQPTSRIHLLSIEPLLNTS